MRVSNQNSQNRRLLITEDDTSLRQMLVWDFEELGYQVSAATCCDEALALTLTEEHHFDLALLDYNLPDGIGIELMEKLHLRYPKLPIILYSGRASGGKARDAKKGGACCFVSKPVGALALHRLFNRVLSGR